VIKGGRFETERRECQYCYDRRIHRFKVLRVALLYQSKVGRRRYGRRRYPEESQTSELSLNRHGNTVA